MKFVSTLFVALLIPVSADAASTCWTPRFVSLVGQTVTAQMTAKSGRSCSIGLASSEGPVKSTRISARPSHGSAVANETRVSYTSKPGYAGEDSFTYSRELTDRYGKQGTKTVVVNVTVVP